MSGVWGGVGVRGVGVSGRRRGERCVGTPPSFERGSDGKSPFSSDRAPAGPRPRPSRPQKPDGTDPGKACVRPGCVRHPARPCQGPRPGGARRRSISPPTCASALSWRPLSLLSLPGPRWAPCTGWCVRAWVWGARVGLARPRRGEGRWCGARNSARSLARSCRNYEPAAPLRTLFSLLSSLSSPLTLTPHPHTHHGHLRVGPGPARLRPVQVQEGRDDGECCVETVGVFLFFFGVPPPPARPPSSGPGQRPRIAHAGRRGQ